MLRYVLRVIGGVIALVAALHIVLGPHADVLLGSEISDLSLGDPTLDSQNRFYGAAFFLYGAILIYCSSDIAQYRNVLSIAIGMIFLAGVARIVSIAVTGWPAGPVVVLLLSELALPPVLLIWIRSVSNINSADSHVPPGWPAVIPRLSVPEPERMVQFLREVFSASGEYHKNRPSEMRIGDSLIMVGGVLERTPTSSLLYVYVEDVDAAYDRAVHLGAVSIEAPEEMAYGDRRAMIQDNWGNRWQIATHRTFEK